MKPLSKQDLMALSDDREREDAVIDAFNASLKQQNYAFARELAEWVVGEGVPNMRFSAGFRMHCLNWLTQFYETQYFDENSDEKTKQVALDQLYDCLWHYKWVVSCLSRDLVEKEELAESAQIMRMYYENANFSQSAVHKALMLQSMLMGDAEATKEHFQLWQSLEADEANDCEACERSDLVIYHHFIGQYAEAVRLAQPIISGEMTCTEVPHITYHAVIDSLLHLGQRKEASALLEQALQLIIQAGDDFVYLLPPLLQLKIQLGQMDDVHDLFEEHGQKIVASAANAPLTYLEYLMAVQAINSDAIAEARKVAALFDERNGNSYYQTRLELLLNPQPLH